MPRKHFVPKPGRFGGMPEIVTGKQLDAGLTPNTTSRIPVSTARRKGWIERLTAYVTTVPVDADGTILVTVKKFNQVSGVTTNLTAAFDLEALVALKPADIPLLSTLTEVQQTLQEGEIIIADVVNNSAAIDTQPKDLTFSAEILILE